MTTFERRPGAGEGPGHRSAICHQPARSATPAAVACRRAVLACPVMRQLLPEPLPDVDPYDAYRPPDPLAPLVRVNMVASVDGAATDERGHSGGLSGAGDQEVFRTLRALADVIVVGAQTVRVEGYGPHRLRADLRARRAADGRPDPAPIVVVSRSLELDLAAPLFTEAAVRTIVLTCEAAPADRIRAARRVALVLLAGDKTVDMGAGIAQLREGLGTMHVLCEGGPTLNVSLFGAGLVDEICLTLSPRLMGAGPRILHELDHPRNVRLAGLCEDSGELYARYTLVR